MQTIFRHVLALATLIGLIYLSSIDREGLHTLHFFNRNVADASYILLCMTLTIGPLVKIVPPLRFLLPWRRELVIAFTVSAGVHVAIYAAGFGWNVTRFFAERNPQGESVLLETPFAISNWVGLLALIYAFILALTSNDIAQGVLGKGWKFLQQQSYTLFVLVGIHTLIFLFMVFNPDSEFGHFKSVFILASAVTIVMQSSGYLLTVWQRSQIRRKRKAQSA
jgi:DMSO/TMAO reductase YedYZ heme-binding membrane subunit